MMIRAPKRRRRRRCDTSALLPFSLLPLQFRPSFAVRVRVGVKSAFLSKRGWTFLSPKRCESIPRRILSSGLGTEWINERRRRRLSSNVKPDSNIAHRESDARARWRWLLVLVLGRRFIFSGRRRRRRRRCCIVPKDVLRHRRGRTRAGGIGRNRSADKENDFTPSARPTISSGFGSVIILSLSGYSAPPTLLGRSS